MLLKLFKRLGREESFPISFYDLLQNSAGEAAGGLMEEEME